MIETMFDKRFAIPLDFDIFKHSVCHYDLKEDLILMLEFNSSEKEFYVLEMPQQRTSIQTYRYNMIQFWQTISQSHKWDVCWNNLIPYTKVTPIHYQTLPKKTLPERLMWITYLFVHFWAWCYYFLIKVMTLPIKMKNFLTQASTNF